MQADYTNELVENPSFIEWVQSDFESNNEEWSQFIDAHPEQLEQINRAIRAVRSLGGAPYEYQGKDLLFSMIEKSLPATPVQHLSKTRIVPLFKKVAVAAGFILVVGMLFFFAGNQSFSTNVGQQMAVQLPDGSSALLNTSSSISYNKWFWSWNRSVSMGGEVFFRVEKGKKFKVVTEEGTVSVLGTSFNVYVFSDGLEVDCFTGKVAVDGKHADENVILTPTEGVRLVKNRNITRKRIPQGWVEPEWKNGREYFDDVILETVTGTIQKYFNEKIVLDSGLETLRLRASVPVHDLDSALQNITWPLGLKYIKEGENVKITR